MNSDHPLSINQEARLLLEHVSLCQGTKLSPFNNTLCYRIQDEVDTVVVEQALNALVSRHEAFRTGLVAPEKAQIRSAGLFPNLGQALLVQRLDDPTEISLQDLSAAEMAGAHMCETISNFASSPFRYDRPPLLRAGFFRTSSVERLLFIAISHLVFDRYSASILRNELCSLFRNQQAHDALPPPGPSFGYSDFSRWQRAAFRDGLFDAGLQYWLGRWDDIESEQLTAQDLGYRPDQGAAQKPQAMQASIDLPAGFVRSARSYARQHHLTPYMLFLAAFAVLLHQCTKKRRVTIWGYFANRVRPHTGRLIGWVANAHPLCIEYWDDMPVQSFLNQVRERVLRAMSHQEVPIGLIWAAYLARKGRPLQLFTDLYVSLDYIEEREAPSSHLLEANPAAVPVSSNSGLELIMWHRSERTTLTISYSPEVVGQDFVTELMLGFQGAAESLTQN